jgi:hypothetical protein
MILEQSKTDTACPSEKDHCPGFHRRGFGASPGKPKTARPRLTICTHTSQLDATPNHFEIFTECWSQCFKRMSIYSHTEITTPEPCLPARQPPPATLQHSLAINHHPPNSKSPPQRNPNRIHPPRHTPLAPRRNILRKRLDIGPPRDADALGRPREDARRLRHEPAVRRGERRRGLAVAVRDAGAAAVLGPDDGALAVGVAEAGELPGGAGGQFWEVAKGVWGVPQGVGGGEVSPGVWVGEVPEGVRVQGWGWGAGWWCVSG